MAKMDWETANKLRRREPEKPVKEWDLNEAREIVKKRKKERWLKKQAKLREYRERLAKQGYNNPVKSKWVTRKCRNPKCVVRIVKDQYCNRCVTKFTQPCYNN